VDNHVKRYGVVWRTIPAKFHEVSLNNGNGSAPKRCGKNLSADRLRRDIAPREFDSSDALLINKTRLYKQDFAVAEKMRAWFAVPRPDLTMCDTFASVENPMGRKELF